MKGKVKFFKEDKGYGFVVDEAGHEYFFHHTKVMNRDVLKKDDEVKFNTEETKKGIQAVNVVRV